MAKIKFGDSALKVEKSDVRGQRLFLVLGYDRHDCLRDAVESALRQGYRTKKNICFDPEKVEGKGFDRAFLYTSIDGVKQGLGGDMRFARAFRMDANGNAFADGDLHPASYTSCNDLESNTYEPRGPSGSGRHPELLELS